MIFRIVSLILFVATLAAIGRNADGAHHPTRAGCAAVAAADTSPAANPRLHAEHAADDMSGVVPPEAAFSLMQQLRRMRSDIERQQRADSAASHGAKAAVEAGSVVD
jgi:hypothetical protein